MENYKIWRDGIFSRGATDPPAGGEGCEHSKNIIELNE